jgi:hypothetical protein
MTWEYMMLHVKSGMLDSDDPFETGKAGAKVGSENLQATLNKLGGDGWEAFSTAFDGKGIISQMVFKRQK